jgi:hypothetical protein
VQQLRSQAAGPFDGPAPEPLEDVPPLAEAGRVGRAHLGPVGIPPVELGVDQGPDVDAIDCQVLDLAVDVHVAQLDAAHHGPIQGDTAEAGAAQVDGVELRAAEVNALEPGATEIGTNESATRSRYRHVLTIGQRRYLSRHTVKTQAISIYRKLR